jgi:hypothetical protein
MIGEIIYQIEQLNEILIKLKCIRIKEKGEIKWNI